MAANTLRRMDYARARRLLLAAGLGVLLVTAAVMIVRRVEPVEVFATLLFVVVFLGFVFWDVRGGLAAAVLAIVVYVALRYPAIEAVGVGRFAGLIASRALAYLAFGLIGGLANRQLEASLEKLELYDQIDDYTGLFNARFFVQDTDLEVSRSKRYQTIFSVAAVDFPAAALESLPRRQRSRILKDLGRMIQDAVRTVDRGVHGYDGSRHRFAIVLPETGAEGARIFTSRLAQRMTEFLREKGAAINPDAVSASSVTYPDDEGGIQGLRDDFTRIDRFEHPDAEGAEGPQRPPAQTS